MENPTLDTQTRAALTATLASLADRADDVTDRIADRIRAEVPDYRDVPLPDLVAGVIGDLQRGIAAVVDQRTLSADEIAQSESLGAERARQGLPVEALIQAFQVGAQTLLDTVLPEVGQAGATPSGLLAISSRTWRWANDVMTRQARAHRRVEVELTAHHAQAEADLVNTLISGALSPEAIAVRTARFGLAADARYGILRARAHDGAVLAALDRTIRRSGAALSTTIGDDLVAIIAKPPPIPPHVYAGWAGPRTLDHAPRAYIEATRVLETSWATHAPSAAHTLADLHLLPAVVQDVALGDVVTARCFGPLAEPSPTADRLVQTLQAWLENDLNIARTAAALYVHTNTVRKRLARYHELTGLDPTRLHDAILIWWALQRRAAETD